MVFTLHRYIFRDLLKTFFLVLLVLSAVLGLGAMLRPLQQFSIHPARVPELIMCTLPITLTMVIPIAALMATTLIYGRLAYDNEITACHSSGISLLTLIYPALILALLVGLATLLLGFHVIPNFIGRFEKIIQNDIKAIIYRNIEKRGNLGKMFPNILIHADHVFHEKDVLSGVAMFEKSSDGIKRISTAQYMKIDLQKDKNGKGQVILQMINAKRIERDGTSANMGNIVVEIDIPSFFRDDIKFKNLDDLKAIQNDMIRFGPIRERFDDIRKQLIAELFFENCDQALRQYSSVELSAGPKGRRERLVIKADGCSVRKAKKQSRKQTEPENKAVLKRRSGSLIKVEYYNSGQKTPARIYKAQQAELRVDTGSTDPSAMLVLKNVTWNFVGDAHVYKLDSHWLGPISLAQTIDLASGIDLNMVRQKTVFDVMKHNEPSSYLSRLCEVLRSECVKLISEITAEKHSRLAFGVSCMVLTLMGAVLGIVFRSGHLLTAFGVSFIPAALCLITIFTGKHMAEQSTGTINLGIIFLWSGIATVAIADIAIYKGLTKH